MSVASYAAQYVRELSRNAVLKQEITARLTQGLAFQVQEEIVVIVCDISGYSKMTSELIIEVINFYEGDVVKFLGDALLVVFSPISPAERIGDVVFRSLACCLHIASTVFHDPSSVYGFASAGAKIRTLRLHFAVTAGRASRVVLGDPKSRLDYSVMGPFMSSLGQMLDGTGEGEMGVSAAAFAYLDPKMKDMIERQNPRRDHSHLLLDGPAVAGLNKLIFGRAFDDDDLAGHFFRTWSSTKGNWRRDSGVAREDDEDFIRKFINQSLVRKLDAASAALRVDTGNHTHAASQANSKRGSFNDITHGIAIPSTRPFEENWRETVHGVANAGPKSGTGPGQSYEVSRNRGNSLASRPKSGTLGGSLGEKEKETSFEVDMDEFRNVAVVFVSLNGFELESVQRIIMAFLNALKRFGGVFQQFSVDDKGQTLLAVFGLPPFAHINNSDQCVKAMKFFSEEIIKIRSDYKVAISVATGEILFSSLGTERRSDTGLLGDVVNIAARLLSISKEKHLIVVDEETYERIRVSHYTIDLGLVRVKGKVDELHVFGMHAVSEDDEEPEELLPVEMKAKEFGYDKERRVIQERYEAWSREKRRAVLFVEAASGMGKSTLARYLMDLADRDNTQCCMTQGSEIDQWTPFRGLKPMLQFILTNLKANARTHNPRGRPKRASTTMSVRRSYHSLATVRSIHTPGQSVRQLQIPAEDLTPFLNRAGVDINLMPLLTAVVPSLPFDESPTTKAMDAQAKVNLLTLIIMKIITAFSDQTPAVFIFDDTQWLDSKALEILMLVSRFCPKIFIQFLSRPLKDSLNQVMNKVIALPDTVHVVLNGLSKEEAYSMIKYKLASSPMNICEVHPAITAAVYTRTVGNPLYLNMVVDVLFEMIGTEFLVTPEGVLELTNSNTDVDAILSDLDVAVMFQFDRLDVTVQRMLKTASVLGLDFDIRDVIEVGNFEYTTEAAMKLLKDNDHNNFLIFYEAEPFHEEGDEVAADPPSDPPPILSEDAALYACAFRHCTILNAIYESLSYEERTNIHKTTAAVLETRMNEDEAGRWSLLPSVEFHYARSNEAEKILDYKEELGCHLVKVWQPLEGVRVLESLLSYVLSRTEDAKGEEGKTPLTVDPMRRAKWLAFLSKGYAVCRSFPKEKAAGIDALELLTNGRWPRNDAEAVAALGPLKRRVFALWVLTLGGSTGSKRAKKVGCAAGALRECKRSMEIMVLSTLIDCFVFDKSFSINEIYFAILSCVNLIICNNGDKVFWSWLMHKMSFYSVFFAPHLHRLLFAAATRYDRYIDNPSYMFTKAANLFFRHDFYLAPGLFERHAKYCLERGDIAGGFFSTCVGATPQAFLGNLDHIKDRASPFFEATPLLREERISAHVYSSILLRRALIKGDGLIGDGGTIKQARELYDRFNYSGGGGVWYAFGNADLCACWQSAVEGQFELALQAFEKSAAIIDVDDIGAIVMDMVACIPFPAVLLLDPGGSGHGGGAKGDGGKLEWDPPQKARLTSAMGMMRKHAVKLGRVRRHVFCWWACEFLEACMMWLGGDVAGAAMHVSKQMKGRRGDELESLVLFKALYCGFLGKYSESDAERASMRSKSKKIFHDIGAGVYVRWIDN
ncbi:hypothetical protein HK101_009015 [Irineochytrium annulatum]|nr:hypothetical protein HK101_009015 [Irineochytrium annulatum]